MMWCDVEVLVQKKIQFKNLPDFELKLAVFVLFIKIYIWKKKFGAIFVKYFKCFANQKHIQSASVVSKGFNM